MDKPLNWKIGFCSSNNQTNETSGVLSLLLTSQINNHQCIRVNAVAWLDTQTVLLQSWELVLVRS